jgi:hypothetical protein
MAPRLTCVLLVVALTSACAPAHMVLLDTGEGTPLEYRPPTTNKSVKVDQDDFEEALGRLVLGEPLMIRSAQQGWLLHASSHSNSPGTWRHSLVHKSFGGMCRPGQPKEGCLSMLDDVMGMNSTLLSILPS